MTYFSIHRVSHCFVIDDGKFKVSTNSGKIFLNSTTILELQCIKRQFPTCLKNNYHFHYFSPFQIRIKTRKGDGIFWIVAKILLNFTNIIPLNTRSYSIPSQYGWNLDCTFEKRHFHPLHIHYKWINVDNWGNFVGHEFHCVLAPRQT